MRNLSKTAIAMPIMPSLIIQVIGHIFLYSSCLSAHIQRHPMQMQCKSQVLPMHTNLSISHTRLHIARRWILWTSLHFVASIPLPIATTSLSLLRATHPCTLRRWGPSPPLVHRRHHRLGSTRLPGASAASYNAAKDRKQKKTANTAAYSDDEIAIVMNPAANFFGSG